MRVGRYFRVLDSLDADAVAALFTNAGVIRLPGAGPLTGRAAIRKAMVKLSLSVEELHHELVSLWSAGNLAVLEADVSLTLTDGTTIAFPATYSVRCVDGLIAEASASVYLESRLAVAMSWFDRARNIDCQARKPA